MNSRGLALGVVSFSPPEPETGTGSVKIRALVVAREESGSATLQVALLARRRGLPLFIHHSDFCPGNGPTISNPHKKPV